MRVLITSTGFFDTDKIVRNFALDQATALRKLGMDVRIMCVDLRTIVHSRHIGKRHELVNGIPVYAYSLPCRLLSETKKSEVGDRLFLKLYKELESEGWIPDIIHAHFVGDQMQGLSERTKSKLVITEHYSGMNTLNPEETLLRRNMRGYKKADYRIAVSTSFKEKLEETTGLSFDVLPNVLDSGVFNKKASSREKHEKIKLYSAGNLTKNKNFSTLIEVISLLEHLNIELHIFGSGSEYKALKTRIEALGLKDKVYLRGKVERKVLLEEYSTGDAFILLSKSETFGVAYIEALACGLPVLSLDCGGTGEFITEENGVIVKSEETAEIAKAVSEFITKLDCYDRERISEEILEKYGYENIANRLIEIYRGLLN